MAEECKGENGTLKRGGNLLLFGLNPGRKDHRRKHFVSQKIKKRAARPKGKGLWGNRGEKVR